MVDFQMSVIHFLENSGIFKKGYYNNFNMKDGAKYCKC